MSIQVVFWGMFFLASQIDASMGQGVKAPSAASAAGTVLNEIERALSFQDHKEHAEGGAASLTAKKGQAHIASAMVLGAQADCREALSDQKGAQETIKYTVAQDMLEKLKQLNVRRYCEPLLRAKAQKLYPLVPPSIVEEQLEALFDPEASKVGMKEDAIKMKMEGEYHLALYERCIPILNGEEDLRAKIKSRFVNLTDKDLLDESGKIMEPVIVNEIVALRVKLFGRLEKCSMGPHEYCWANRALCKYYKAYSWLREKWEQTKKLKDDSHKEILKKCILISCFLEQE